MSDATERLFPLHPSTRKLAPDFAGVPWSFVAPHERQARANHGQTLDRLAERGGLGACELLAVLEGRPWRAMEAGAAVAELRERVAAWAMRRGGR